MVEILRSSTTSFSMKIVTLLQLLLVINHVVHATVATRLADVAESHQTNQAQTNMGNSLERRGPWGGDGGTEFDDIRSMPSDVIDVLGIQTIKLWHGEKYIRGIQVQYQVANSSQVYPYWGQLHGQSKGNKHVDITLQYPKELIKQVRGYYGTPGNYKALTSMKFVTNDGTYGPFGDQDGISFTSGTIDQKQLIVGIFGKSRVALNNLGVYINENLHDRGGD